MKPTWPKKNRNATAEWAWLATYDWTYQWRPRPLMDKSRETSFNVGPASSKCKAHGGRSNLSYRATNSRNYWNRKQRWAPLEVASARSKSCKKLIRDGMNDNLDCLSIKKTIQTGNGLILTGHRSSKAYWRSPQIWIGINISTREHIESLFDYLNYHRIRQITEDRALHAKRIKWYLPSECKGDGDDVWGQSPAPQHVNREECEGIRELQWKQRLCRWKKAMRIAGRGDRSSSVRESLSLSRPSLPPLVATECLRRPRLQISNFPFFSFIFSIFFPKSFIICL